MNEIIGINVGVLVVKVEAISVCSYCPTNNSFIPSPAANS